MSSRDPREAEWEPFVPLHRDPVPAFPLEALPSKFAVFASELSRFTETAPDLACVLVLAALAASVACKVTIAPKPGYVEPLNIMVFVALPPGERKSAVFRHVFNPLDRREKELQAEAEGRADAADRQREDLNAQLKAVQHRAKTDPRAAADVDALRAELENTPSVSIPRLLADDATPEALAPLLASNGGRLCLASAEGGIVATLAGRYSKGVPNIDVFLKAHAGDVIRVDRRNAASVIVHNPALTVALAVQPSVLTELVNQKEFRSRGLVARFLFSLPSPRAGSRCYDEAFVPEPIAREYDATLARLLTLKVVDPVRELQFDRHALQAWLEFAVEVERKCGEGSELASIADWISKLPGAVARLAGLLHLGDLAWDEHPWDERVSVATIERAIALGRYFLAHTVIVLGAAPPDERTKDAEALLVWVAKRPDFSVRELQRSNARFAQGERARATIGVLEERGYVKERPQANTGRGRPASTVYDVHPALAADSS